MNDGTLVDNDLVLIQACMDVVDKINTSSYNKIILEGIKKSGKTTTLKCLASKKMAEGNMMIYAGYDELEYEAGFSVLEYNYYYELLLAKKIIDFIKGYNSDYYQKFIMYERFIVEELQRFNDYLCTRIYDNVFLDNFVGRDFIFKILELLRSCDDIKCLTLLIDNFDEIGKSSKRFQTFMLNYFDMFDKVLVTSCDERLKNEEVVSKANGLGYDVISVDYSKNILYVKRILFLYFKNWFEHINSDNLLVDRINNVYAMIDDDGLCRNLINITNGNIDMMISIFRRYFIQSMPIDKVISQVIGMQKTLEKNTYKRKLHII